MDSGNSRDSGRSRRRPRERGIGEDSSGNGVRVREWEGFRGAERERVLWNGRREGAQGREEVKPTREDSGGGSVIKAD